MAQQRRCDRTTSHPSHVPANRIDAKPSIGGKTWIALIVLGIVLRFLLAAISIGTNDAAAWLRFGDEINQHGLLQTYQTDPDFNHPPIPGYWAALCAKAAGNGESTLHDWVFTSLFKLAPIFGDCLAMYLLFLIWRGRRDGTGALVVAALFSFSLDAIVVSGFHCNTDSLLIAICLLSIYLYEDRHRSFLSGLALAAAINIKLIPVLLVPGLLLAVRKWRDAVWFTLGLALGVVPFIVPLLEVPGPFLSNVLRYNSMVDRWGLNFFFLLGETTWSPSHPGEALSTAYYSKARYVILVGIVIWAVFARLKPRWDRYEISLITFTILLFFAPGFGVQYTVLVGLVLFAIRPRLATAYAWLAGLFVASAYFMYWRGGFPLYSHWGVLFPEPVGTLGLLTWLMLVVIACIILIRPASLVDVNTSRHNSFTT